MTEKELVALKALQGATRCRPFAASALARKIWPEKFVTRSSSPKRGGLYRAAGGYYSKLVKKGWVAFWMDDFHRGYYLTSEGMSALSAAMSAAAPTGPAGHLASPGST